MSNKWKITPWYRWKPYRHEKTGMEKQKKSVENDMHKLDGNNIGAQNIYCSSAISSLNAATEQDRTNVVQSSSHSIIT